MPPPLDEHLGLPDPAGLPTPGVPVLLAYHRFHEGLRLASDGGVVFEEWEGFGLNDWLDFDDSHVLARIVVSIAILPYLRDALEARVVEELESGSWANDSDDPDDWSWTRKLLEKYREFLTTDQGEFLNVHTANNDAIDYSVCWTIYNMISSSGCISVVGFTDEWCAVFDLGEGRGDDLGRLPMFLGFASRTCLHRSVGRVITDTLGQLYGPPDELYGSGLDDFEVAFIGACLGQVDDQPLGEALLSVDDALARATFDRNARPCTSCDGDPSLACSECFGRGFVTLAKDPALALIEWAEYGCPGVPPSSDGQ